MSLRSLCIAFVVLVGLGTGCGDDDDRAEAPQAPSQRRDGGGREPRADAGPPLGASKPIDAGGPSAPHVRPDDEGVQDRCLVGSCGPTQLPAQPELEFLEDMGDGWQRLVEVDWELAAGSEGYRCKTFTVPKDIYITAFAPQSPMGTHHSTYGVIESAHQPDEVVACGVGNSGERRLQGSGAGSEASQLPPGVAMPLRAGNQIFMNLHLFNFGQKALSGRSGMWVKTVPAAAVEHEAEVVLAGPLQLDIPVGRSTQRGSCTLRADATIFGLSPHMHQKGVHMRAMASSGGKALELYDGDYDFTHQLHHPIDPVQLKAGDRIELECTYLNDTTSPLHWGDSSLDEMCFIGVSLYPAVGYGSIPCAN